MKLSYLFGRLRSSQQASHYGQREGREGGSEEQGGADGIQLRGGEAGCWVGIANRGCDNHNTDLSEGLSVASLWLYTVISCSFYRRVFAFYFIK